MADERRRRLRIRRTHSHSRNLAKRLREETRGARHIRLDVDRWLRRPHAKVDREEVYTLLRQWHYEVERRRFLRNPFLSIPWALWLIITTPVRLLLRWARRKGRSESE